MKKNLLSLLLSTIITSYAFGQITLEKTYPSENLQVFTNNAETYYYTVGWNLSTIKIYNSDYSLKKQFTPTIPVGYEMVIRAYDNFFLSKNLFNFDNLLEIVVAFAKYDTTINEFTYKIIIYNEDGQIVKDFGDGYNLENEFDFHIYHDSNANKNKLRLFNLATNSTEIYNLSTNSLTTKEITYKNKLSAFPIPTNKNLNIINPNNGNNNLQVYDQNGKIVLNKSFMNSEKIISLDVEFLPKGIYIYKIGNINSKFFKN
ncbi:T9SS type A sorting domain-containing protein [Cloacibacterium sp.]|uniref:T9SS type A sorting domain-containing protein n=1 Tax=Cloacibacterium sp. TaxID=1913682 RepID=UPI0039E4E898